MIRQLQKLRESTNRLVKLTGNKLCSGLGDLLTIDIGEGGSHAINDAFPMPMRPGTPGYTSEELDEINARALKTCKSSAEGYALERIMIPPTRPNYRGEK